MSDTANPASPKPAAPATLAANAALATALPLDDPADFERASRGLIATHETGVIHNAKGRVVWDIGVHDFVRGDDAVTAPDTVNPSLWRQARLNAIHGLFEITDGVWQVRGYDIANITFIESDTGWLVIDPLTAAETARTAYELVTEHVGHRTVKAVIYTHSHVDHFGGIHGIVDEADVAAGKVRIIAPEGFLAEAVSENVIAGPAMLRRASYMFGGLLPRGVTGHIDSGLGKAVARGTVGLIPPTEEISETGQEMVIDGVRVVFQYTPDAEAPAEMCFHFPDKRLLCMAENCTQNMHNLLTPRGALVRDALSWSKYINEAIELFGAETDICFASHHWPRFGHDDSIDFLSKQRDLYRWLHDQTMRLANHGFTPLEIAEQLEHPPELVNDFHTRGYYGTISHNSKAVYQRYIGWFDGNPANLHPLPPEEAGAKYVAAMGGADAVLALGQAAFDDGDFRWAAQLMNHLIFGGGDNAGARQLQADIFEQMGYQAESGPWRNFYLTGAQELRNGVPDLGAADNSGFIDALTVDQLFDAIGVRLNGPQATGKKIAINWHFTDIDERHILGLENCALHHTPGRNDPAAEATVTMTRSYFGSVIAQRATFIDGVSAGDITIEGDPNALIEVFGCLDKFERGFAIATP